MGLYLVLTNDVKKLKKQIFALEWQIEQEDLSEKDKSIFIQSLAAMKEHIKQLEQE